MDEREQQILGWAIAERGLQAGKYDWQSVAGDASARRYFRLLEAEHSLIAMDAPPESEKNQAFLDIRALLEAGGVRVPALKALDLDAGFLLLEDLGDELLLDHLRVGAAAELYGQAMDMLLHLQVVPGAGELPVYDETVLAEELSRFREWFCQGLLQLELTASEQLLIERACATLINEILQQPQVLVHRDYHSRNLLLLKPGVGRGLAPGVAQESPEFEQAELACIDFQDALYGPLCYDLVSLLRDCYVRWPADAVRHWALSYRQRLLCSGRPAADDEQQFLRWFDWTGLQRHLKVLGNFSRLALRDNKPAYLSDIPLVFDYCQDVLASYSELSDLAQFMENRVQPRLADALKRAGA